MRFWICCGYYGFIGLLFFIIGRILPKKWFDYNAFPYKAFDCEKDGKIYKVCDTVEYDETHTDDEVIKVALSEENMIIESNFFFNTSFVFAD